jgi:hypothetical protein
MAITRVTQNITASKMKWLVLVLFCVPSWAAIANVGSCAAGTVGTPVNNCTLSATGAGDLNVFWAYRSGSTTAPALPAGMTNIGTFGSGAGGTTGVGRLYCKLASSGSDTGSGTATNATGVAGLSYSGINAPSNLSAACAGMGVAQGNTQTAKTSTTVTYPLLTLLQSNWVAAFMGGSAATCTPASGLASRSSTTAVNALDTNGAVSSFSAETCTVSSETWISVDFVLLVPAALATGSNPQLKRSYGIFTNEAAVGGSTTTYQQFMDPSGSRQAVAGDLVVIFVTFPDADTLTISDSTAGSNTWTQDATANGTASSDTHRIYHSILAASISSITFTLSAASDAFGAGILVFYNVATSSIVDGTATCKTDITPSFNFGSTIQSTAITTTANGDLVVQFIRDEDGGNLGAANTILAIAPGDGQQFVTADKFMGTGAQYFVQASAGSIQPGMSLIQTGSLPVGNTTYATCTAAYKAGSGGTAPSGAGIVHQQLIYPAGTAGPIVLQFPSSGNLLVMIDDLPSFTSAASDSQSNTYALIANTSAGSATDAKIEYAGNATTANNLALSQPFTSAGNNTLWVLYDVAGMATSSVLDTGATVPGGGDTSVITATSSGASRNGGTQSGTTATQAPTLIPSSGRTELFIMAGSNGTGPVTSLTNATYSYINGTNAIGDGNSVNNGDHSGYAFSASSVSVTLNFGGTETNSWSAIMAAFNSAPAGVTENMGWFSGNKEIVDIIKIGLGIQIGLWLFSIRAKAQAAVLREILKVKKRATPATKEARAMVLRSLPNAIQEKRLSNYIRSLSRNKP